MNKKLILIILGCALVLAGSAQCIKYTSSVKNASCGLNNGSVVITPTAGVAPFSYTWTTSLSSIPFSYTSDASNIAGGNITYFVKITDNLGCIINPYFNISTSLAVTANFTADSLKGMMPFKVSFTNTSLNASSYLWIIDGDSIRETSPNYTFEQAGTYNISLTAFNANKTCKGSKSLVVTTNDSPEIIPNIFTPNGDGVNDVFALKFKKTNTIEVQIFNRYGIRVNSYNGREGYWDGTTFSGSKCNDGTYFYFYTASFKDGTTTEGEGSIVLISDSH